MSLVKVLRKDQNYKKLKKILEVARTKVDVAKDRATAMNLHSSLEVRDLYGQRKFSAKRILSATSQVQANRSSLVVLRARATEHVSYVEQAVKSFKRYAFTEYREDFSDYRTKEQRDAVVQTALGSADDFIQEIQGLLDLLDLLIKDLDQSSHALRHMIDVLKLLDASKGGRII